MARAKASDLQCTSLHDQGQQTLLFLLILEAITELFRRIRVYLSLNVTLRVYVVVVFRKFFCSSY